MKWKTKRYYKNQNELLKLEVLNLNTEIDKLEGLNDKNDETIKEVEKSLKKTSNELREANEIISKYEKEVNNLKNKLNEKEEQRKEAAGKLGGLTKENNKLKEEKKEFKTKIKELEIELDKRYIIKKLPSGKMPKGQKMSIKRSGVQSRIIKNIKGDYGEVENED